MDEAIARLNQAIAAHEDGGTPFDWLALAMAYHRIGDSEAARRQLDQANRWLDDAARGIVPYTTFEASTVSWEYLGPLRMLHAEAAALLGTGLPALPTDVFARPSAEDRQ
jgi:hypothetical protein